MSNKSPWTQTFAGQPVLGSRAERSRTTTMCDVEMFTEMTGDRNPIHYDVELATKSPFGGLIVQGGVTTGLLNAVVAEDLKELLETAAGAPEDRSLVAPDGRAIHRRETKRGSQEGAKAQPEPRAAEHAVNPERSCFCKQGRRAQEPLTMRLWHWKCRCA